MPVWRTTSTGTPSGTASPWASSGVGMRAVISSRTRRTVWPVRLSPPGLLAAWVALLDDAVVGHALVTTPKSGDAAVEAWTAQGGELSRIAVGGRLFVAPAGRGHDLGTRLAQTLTDWAANEGYDLVGDVMEKDQAALRIYERIGWRRIGTAMHATGHGTEVPALLFVRPAPGGRG
jgi:GNAT superfamily N-acetyltransferase